jgi:hypothetical protein
MQMFTLDNLFLLLTGLLAAYLCWYFWRRYNLNKALYNIYYLMGFAVLLISGLLLIFHPSHLGLLSSPFVLTVASLIPLGISMGLAEDYQHRGYGWAKENCRPTLPRRGRTGDLPRTIFRQGRAERILVGWHRWSVDRPGRDRASLHLHGQTTVVLQPRVRHDDPHSPPAPDDSRVRFGLYKKGIV